MLSDKRSARNQRQFMKAPSRRTVMISAAAATFAAVSWKFYSDRTESYLAEDLAEIFETYRPYAISIGDGYLQCTPHEADPDTLASLLTSDRTSFPDQPEALRRYIRDKIRRDFANGHVTEIDGWILSNTESRLCAIVALAHKDA